MEPELKYDAALRAARAQQAAAHEAYLVARFDRPRDPEYLRALKVAAEKAGDAVVALARAVGATVAHGPCDADCVPDAIDLAVGTTLLWDCCRAKAEADRLAAPYLEKEESLMSKREAD